MFRTTGAIENSYTKMAKILGFENDPKWMTLRFAIFISLSLPSKNFDGLNFDYSAGIQYKAEVIIGKNKPELNGINADYTDIIAIMVSNYHNCELEDINSLEKYLEKHCVRGFDYLEKSLNEKSDLFIWLLDEFKLSL